MSLCCVLGNQVIYAGILIISRGTNIQIWLLFMWVVSKSSLVFSRCCFLFLLILTVQNNAVRAIFWREIIVIP